jgi:hypothetical protein
MISRRTSTATFYKSGTMGASSLHVYIIAWDGSNAVRSWSFKGFIPEHNNTSETSQQTQEHRKLYSVAYLLSKLAFSMRYLCSDYNGPFDWAQLVSARS